MKKKALMEKIAARDLAVQQTSHHFADAELGRLSSTKSALQAFIDLEMKQLAARMKALGTLTHSLTYLLTHSLTYLLTHSLTHR